MAKGKYRDQEFVETFGQRVREVRKSKGMTIEDFADKTGFPNSTIARIERAEINPTISVVKRLAEGLDVSIHLLFDFV
ncbi:MAG: helix-turn-helix transcriptional regulator [Bacteroidia bacterium]|nr:helix-turn-helix transcriptional regulator [Bacteroidia bacterium]